jgi:hypothetical protein
MTRITRPALQIGLAASVLVTATVLAQPAQADPLPFSDPHAQGQIGLCDSSGHPIQNGSTISHPYVVAAGSTEAAPAGYQASKGGKATLYAFQPRQDVDPGQWSGFQLTGSSAYADGKHPLVSGTNLDPSLKDFVTAFPARWDGLVQLRIYYTAPNTVAFKRSYPAAVLRVQGNQWTLVQGAQLNCDLAKVVSSEKLLLPASAFDPAHPAVTDAPSLTAPATAASASSPVKGGSATPAAQGSSSGAVPALDAVPAAATRDTSSSSTPWVVAGLVLVGIAGLAGAAAVRARSRSRIG